MLMQNLYSSILGILNHLHPVVNGAGDIRAIGLPQHGDQLGGLVWACQKQTLSNPHFHVTGLYVGLVTVEGHFILLSIDDHTTRIDKWMRSPHVQKWDGRREPTRQKVKVACVCRISQIITATDVLLVGNILDKFREESPVHRL